eukprot:15163784-Ditylum_brightwellii.AAC.1
MAQALLLLWVPALSLAKIKVLWLMAWTNALMVHPTSTDVMRHTRLPSRMVSIVQESLHPGISWMLLTAEVPEADILGHDGFDALWFACDFEVFAGAHGKEESITKDTSRAGVNVDSSADVKARVRATMSCE